MSTLVKAICFVFCISASSASLAKSQALLIGIGQYPGRHMLEGPVNDVALIKDILLQNESFSSEHIEELVDEEATRSNILNGLDNLLKSTVSGDKIILYFSGHGTSALNDHIDADLPSHSGALVPYDIDSVTNKDELNQRLLIGRRDLLPVLSKLDANGVEVLVLVDACFSGNVVRGDDDARSLPARFLDLSELLNFQKKVTVDKPAGLIQDAQYPYQNVFLIAAAQEHQTAHDIPEAKVAQYGTVDSRPHGAFTDSLVQTLIGLYGRKNGEKNSYTLTDLHVATRRLMKKRGLLSTPSLLPEDLARTNATTLAGFFGQSVSIAELRKN